MASRDYYSVLQVNPSASQEAIDASYARLSRLYDPQASKKRKAALRKQALEQAYEVLSDRQRRSEYDRLRSKGWLPGQPLPGASRASGFLDRYLSNPYIFAGAVAGGVVIVLVAIVLISLVGEGGTESAVTELPTVTPGQPTPTLPAQSPTTAPASPPEVAGEEVTLPSGLRYIEIQPGTAAMPSLGDTAVVNYTGWLQSDGTKFDSSLERPEPFSFTLGMGEVIQGWEEGVGSMMKGGKRRLIIPPELGYGGAGSGNIPPNATLIFDIELIEVFPAATPPPSPAPTPAPQAQPTETAPVSPGP